MKKIFVVKKKNLLYIISRLRGENFGGKKFGNNRGGHETPAQSNRFSVADSVGGNRNLQLGHHKQRDACEQPERRKILVRATSRNFRAGQRGNRNNFHELRLSRTSSARKSTLHHKFDNAARRHAFRTRGTRRAEMDTNRAGKFAAVGICEVDNDNLHGVDFGRESRKFKFPARFIAGRGLRRRAVHFSFKTAGLGHVAGFHGNFFRNDNSLRNPVENFIRSDNRGNRLHADTLAIFERLSENANNGFP